MMTNCQETVGNTVARRHNSVTFALLNQLRVDYCRNKSELVRNTGGRRRDVDGESVAQRFGWSH